MWLRRALFLLVATLVLWYLGHFGLNAILLAFAPQMPVFYSRILDMVLIPVSAAIAWVVMVRLTPGRKGITGHGRFEGISEEQARRAEEGRRPPSGR